jgi:hypothetical protein
VWGSILPLLFLAVAPVLHAGSLDSSIIGMFPKDVTEFGFADLKEARGFSWYPQLEAQLVPVSLYSFEQFLAAAQMRQTPSIDQVAWGRVSGASGASTNRSAGGGQLVAVAVGHFDGDALQYFLSSRKVPSVQAGEYTMYASGAGSGAADVFFAVVDSETIAFGPREPLERVLGVRGGGEENLLESERMIALIDQANGDGIFWGVLDSAQAGRAIAQLIPEAASFPQSRDLIGKMKELLVTVKASSGMEIDFQASSASPSDALLLSQLLQAGLLYRRYRSSQDDSGLSQILDGVRVAYNGSLLEMSLALTDDQMLSLIEHNTFTLGG